MLDRRLDVQVRSKSRTVIFLALTVGLLVAGYGVGTILYSVFQSNGMSAQADGARPSGGAVVEPPRLLSDFTLTSQTGEPIRLSDLRGHTAVLFFGYTHCPDVCPLTLADFTRVKQALGDAADTVDFVFITVDGARDTPEVMADFLNRFDPDFIGMTADEATLRWIGSEFGLLFQQETEGIESPDDDLHEDMGLHGEIDDLDHENYFVQHTSPVFLVDPDGYLRTVYFYGTKPGVIAKGIRAIQGSA